MPELNARLFDVLRASAADPARERGAHILQDFSRELRAAERGEVFVTTAYFASVLTSLEEENWLQARGDTDLPAADRTSEHLAFLQPVVGEPHRWRALSAAALALGKMLTDVEHAMPLDEHRALLGSATRRMAALLELEDAMSPRLCDLLHHAFDGLDLLFGLDYRGDLDATAPAVRGTERLFTGSGAGVQSSYVTIFAALRQLRPGTGATLVDLGSGYGRVGLALGVARPDMQLVGYEYVGHRVEMSTRVAARAGLGERVRFFQQDLADEGFSLPPAEIYYLYDPFSAATYGRVMKQIRAMGRQRPIAVVTKGNAGARMEDSIVGEGWSARRYDLGNMCLFRSPAAA